MVIYLAVVKNDKDREEIKKFIIMCKMESIKIEFSEFNFKEKDGELVLKSDEIEKIKKSDIAIIIFSNSSIYSTALTGLFLDMQNHFNGKYFYHKLDQVELPKAFLGFVNNMQEITNLNKSDELKANFN